MRISVIFRNNKSGNLWVKSFRSKNSAKRAVLGITKKTKNLVADKLGNFSTITRTAMMRKSKGLFYGKHIKTDNRLKF
jgi:hypothetical protein